MNPGTTFQERLQVCPLEMLSAADGRVQFLSSGLQRTDPGIVIESVRFGNAILQCKQDNVR